MDKFGIDIYDNTPSQYSIAIPIHFAFVINLECQYKLRVVAFMILIYYHLNKKYYCKAHVLFLLLTIS